MQHSEKFKSEMVSKMMGPSALSAKRLSEECGIGQPTLSTWLRKAKVAAMTNTPVPKPAAAKQWSAKDKMRVVLEAAAAGPKGRGLLLRQEGLHEAELSQFQAELERLVEDKPTRPVKRDAKDKKRINALEREIRRKDRALAEATALVVLSKKLHAYFGEDEVGETDEESER